MSHIAKHIKNDSSQIRYFKKLKQLSSTPRLKAYAHKRWPSRPAEEYLEYKLPFKPTLGVEQISLWESILNRKFIPGLR